MSSNEIFVFGSNLAGRHGKSAAFTALKQHGAVYGQGVGRQGNSYGIPTKDERLRVLPLEVIKRYVSDFLDYARENPDMTFKVTKIGTGEAGYENEFIAPMFERAPENCTFDFEWARYLGSRYKYFRYKPQFGGRNGSTRNLRSSKSV
jgi:hypothetical protein